MSPHPDETSARFRSVLGIGALGLLLLLALGGLKGYRDLATARQRESELATRIRESQARVRSLERRIESLRDDPAALEKLARDELMMVRPGEVVVVPVRREAPATPSDPAAAEERP